jgi:hypothetical protein
VGTSGVVRGKAFNLSLPFIPGPKRLPALKLLLKGRVHHHIDGLGHSSKKNPAQNE